MRTDRVVEPRAAGTITLLAQGFLGLCCYLFFVLPYVHRIHGLRRTSRARRLFAVNHVSLLDTIMLGGIFWSRRRLPILVLGDREVWRRGPLRRLLSAHVGFLIDRRRATRERISELRCFGASHRDHELIVFPEGTRGDGRQVAPCQPGLFYVAREARVPITPVFIQHMERVSSKNGKLHLLGGLRTIEVRFGPEIAAEEYLALPREAFLQFVRERIQALGPRT